MAASLLLHSPIKRRHSLSSIPGNWRLQSGGIEASSTPAIEGTRPPPSCLCPIKGCPALGEDHTSNAPSLSPQRDLTAALPSRGSAAGETPLHRPPNRDNPVVELTCPSFPSITPWSELSGTGTAGGRAPERGNGHRSTVYRAGAVHGLMDLVHRFFIRKTIPGNSDFQHFALRLLIFFNINPQSLILQLGPWNLKNNSKKVPSLRKIHKNSPKISKFHIFLTTTPNLVIPSPKFSGSLLLSFYAFI
jgi:hypothetical protein